MATRARLVAPVALVALSAVAALSLGRLLDSSRFVVPVLGAAVLPHVVGAIGRRRRLALALVLLVTAIALALYVVLALEWSTTHAGIPSASTWHAIRQQAANGWHLLRTAPAPAPTTDGAVLLGVIAVWCMATLADWLAFSRSTTLAAVAPALVFFVWTSTLGTTDDRWLLTGAFCVAAGAFLLAQSLAVVDRRRTWLAGSRAAKAHWLVPASTLTLAAVALALLVTPVLPGAGSDPLLDFVRPASHGGGIRSYRPELAPFVDIGDKLDSPDNKTELFTVKAPRPEYWRIAALDTYSGDGGGQWTLSAEGSGSVTVWHDPSSGPADATRQEFRIGPLSERWVPAAFDPVAISLHDTLVVDSSGTLVTGANSVRGLRYTVASNVPLDYDAVPAPARQATDHVPRDLEHYAKLPPGVPHVITQTARDAAGSGTQFQKAERLWHFFRDPESGFVYDTTVDPAGSGDAIANFLRQKRGYCVQFASAYAVMARAVGIPARVAVGFTPGTSRNGVFHVTAHDAHAWPEIYLPRLGWTNVFDPTPGHRVGMAGGSDKAHEPSPTGNITKPPPSTTSPTGTTTPGPTRGGNGSAPTAAPVAKPTVTTEHHSAGLRAWWLVALAGIAFVLVVVGYVVAVLTVKRRRRERRRGAPAPGDAIFGAWYEALDRLLEADVIADPTLTPRELAAVAPGALADTARSPLARLADTYTATRYGTGNRRRDDVDRAWIALDELERALDASVSTRVRLRRRLNTGPLRSR